MRCLVTGITGFIGSQVGKLMLEKGYLVRGTVRSKKNEQKMRPVLSLPHQERLEIVEADLLNDDRWDEAVKGCQYVAHVASPFPLVIPKNEELLQKPAVQGTLSVLRACARTKGCHKVVLTSSVVAIQGVSDKPEFDETNWPDPASISGYHKSKYLAEKSAWDFYNALPQVGRFKMSTINPGLTLGPSLVSTDFTSGEAVKQMMTGKMVAIPRVSFGIVDVRDVAAAHIAALESKISDGQRYLCVADRHMWCGEIAEVLRGKFGKYGYKIPKHELPYFLMKLAGTFNPTAKSLLPYWNKSFRFHNEKIKTHLKLKFTPSEDAIIATAESLIALGRIYNEGV